MDTSESPSHSPAQRPKLSPNQRRFLGIASVITLVLFVAPSFYIVKYNTIDRPREKSIAERCFAPVPTDEARQRISSPDPDNIELQERVVRDSPDAALRSSAVSAMAAMAGRASFTRPMEALNAKMTLAYVAAHDPDAAVRQAAADALAGLARRGAVLQR
jgi:hypothetical protein